MNCCYISKISQQKLSFVAKHILIPHTRRQLFNKKIFLITLQSAHCLAPNFSEFYVYLGQVDKNQPSSWESRIIDQSAFHPHPDYNETTRSNDIGLIFLSDATPQVLESDFIDVVNLPIMDSNLIGHQAVISGFGSTGGFEMSEVLNAVEVRIVENQFCVDAFGYYATDANLCTETDGGRSSCNGDEGEWLGGGLRLRFNFLINF